MKSLVPIVITGFMGCGKTEIARKLAHRLKLTVVDLDEEITSRSGRSPARLIAEDGEPAFREIETETLRELLQNGHAQIIALGGGAWIQDGNRKLIAEANGTSVFLDTPFEVCWQRIEMSGDDRPLGKSHDQASSLFERRHPVYRLADVTINSSSTDSIEELALRVETNVVLAQERRMSDKP